MDWVGTMRQQGVAVINRAIAPAMVDELIHAVEAIPPSETAREKGGSVYAMRNLLRDVPETRRLAESAALRGLAEPILGRDAFVVRGLLFDKTPEANWLVPWHQDLTIAVQRRTDAPGYGPWTRKGGVPHVQPPIPVLERMLTIRVQLDDTDENNGPLRVVPGSHTSGKLSVEATREHLARGPVISCLVPRGGAVLMRPLLLHSSSPATAPGHRRVIHLEYAADPLPANVNWFDWNAEVEVTAR